MEETFDPDDWEQFRRLAHRMVDETIDHLRTLREKPVWQPIPGEVRASFQAALPREGKGEEAAYDEFRRRILPYPNGNLHPRFFGWVQGNGTPLAMMADMLAAAMNPHMAGFDQAPALVEHEVLRWLAELMGFPAEASGVMVTGGTMANTLGLAVARHAKAGFDVRELGLAGGPRLKLYGSAETHSWAQKACELLGLGNAAFRRVEASGLREAIRRDREEGHKPFCLVGTAGTVNTGASDDLSALADLAAEEGLWLHVDGAFGALAYLSPRLRPRVSGLDRADSLGFDLHKWGYLPFECACVLVRDATLHRATFATAAAYLEHTVRGPIAGGLPFADRGMDLTRGFKALKVWLTFQAYGVDKMVRLIEQNVDQAAYLGRRIEERPELELVTPVHLNVVCFRHRGPDSLNEEILLRLQESGIASPSGTRLGGRHVIRVCIVNHRTRREDLDLMLDTVLRLGGELA